MAEKWRRYETLMIFDPTLGVDGTEELIQKVREYVAGGEGRVLKTERWGLRDLAFELKGRRKGYYLILEYAGVPTVASELDRRLNLLDTVVKFQTLKLEDAVDPAALPEPVEIAPEEVRVSQPTPLPRGRDDEESGETEGPSEDES